MASVVEKGQEGRDGRKTEITPKFLFHSTL